MGKKRFVFILTLILLAVSLSSEAYAQRYYADLTIDVQNDGTLKISGITNDPSLAPGVYTEFTDKKGIYWLLNISSDQVFSDYILAVKLPDGAEFNYLKTSGRSRVSYDNGIKIIASGTGSLALLVQYQINDAKKPIFLIWLIIVIFGVVILGFLLWKKFSKKLMPKNKIEAKNKHEKNKRKNTVRETEGSADSLNDGYEKARIIKKTLAESQEKIIDLLLDAGGELVQKQLQHRSGLPKATLSRNIDVLLKKDIIIKQSRGMTNMIILKKDIKDK